MIMFLGCWKATPISATLISSLFSSSLFFFHFGVLNKWIKSCALTSRPSDLGKSLQNLVWFKTKIKELYSKFVVCVWVKLPNQLPSYESSLSIKGCNFNYHLKQLIFAHYSAHLVVREQNRLEMSKWKIELGLSLNEVFFSALDLSLRKTC